MDYVLNLAPYGSASWIKPRWGTFTSGETAYYHIWNDSGVLSNTQSVVVP